MGYARADLPVRATLAFGSHFWLRFGLALSPAHAFLGLRFFFAGGVGVVAVPSRACKIAAPLGLPQPVHGSHPGPAL